MSVTKKALALQQAGFCVIPVDKNKQPLLRSWGTGMKPLKPSAFRKAWGFGLLMGQQGLVCIDFDLKYDITGDLMERVVDKIPKHLLDKMLIQTTKNKGYHFIYMTEQVGKNRKLAERNTTEQEKYDTFVSSFSVEPNFERAYNIARNNKSKVLIETREKGGYCVMAPSPGYEIVQGDSINFLNEQEHQELVDIFLSFNEVERKSFNPFSGGGNIDIIKYYKTKVDTVELLQQYGWQIISEYEDTVRFKRPGATYSTSSALYDRSTGVFTCFSTSTSLEPNQPYSSIDLLAHLKFDDDFNETMKYLEKNY